MIRLISRPSELFLDGSYFSGRINAACDAYGTGYDFCRLYRFGKGSGLIYNSSCVLCGDCDDSEEISDFIMINSPETVECPPSFGERLYLPSFEGRRRILFERRILPDDDDIPEAASLMDMYDIVRDAFGNMEFDLWYADMSHRIRHGVSRAFMYHGVSCACVDFVYEGAAYISQVATLSDERGKGYAGKLLDMISRMLLNEGNIPRLWAFEELEGFYRKAGFVPIAEDCFYININK
ncbi:MAG: GNAT family N-acetyltransferase [Oscillospiraceae bacterium]|nr:GNAT family N-acetyltransferase [Oscillospiraceae bacterium]